MHANLAKSLLINLLTDVKTLGLFSESTSNEYLNTCFLSDIWTIVSVIVEERDIIFVYIFNFFLISAFQCVDNESEIALWLSHLVFEL